MRYAIWNEFVAVEVEHIHAPRDAADVQALVRGAREQGKRVKPVGAGHSFNDIALNEHALVDLRQLNRLLAVDLETRTVRVQGGMPLYALVHLLDQLGLALPNIGAWTEQTVAGVLATATHGTGGRYRKSLVEAASEVVLVDGRGELRVLRGPELGFLALGFFGIVVEVELRCEPLFFVRQSNLLEDGEQAIARLPERLESHDFVDLRWVGSVPGVITRRWDIVSGPPGAADRAARLYEGVKLNALNHFLSLLRSDALSQRQHDRLFGALAKAYVRSGEGLPSTAVWHEGLTFNSLGAAAPHEEREFAIPLARAEECLLSLRQLMLREPAAASLEIQVRFSPAVDIVLAPNQGRDTVWFNLNVMAPARTKRIVEQVSRAIYAFDARPHWAKVVPAGTPPVEVLYGDDALRWEERRRSFDPDGVFLNDWYHRHLGLTARRVGRRGLSAAA